MGRLTLNVLLSFAQFEREVTGERIRDKIAASKAKGMWMGGMPPIGYEVMDKTLVIHGPSAIVVREIYQTYLILGNVRLLKVDLDGRGLKTPARLSRRDNQSGNLPFTRGHLYRILSNPVYIGQVAHRDIIYPGQHQPIIDQRLWDAVQAQLISNQSGHKGRNDATDAALLSGLVFGEDGEPLVSIHSKKRSNKATSESECKLKYEAEAQSQPEAESTSVFELENNADSNPNRVHDHYKRYRYYVSQKLVQGLRDQSPQSLRIPAEELEQAVIGRLISFLQDGMEILILMDQHGLEDAVATHAVLENASSMSNRLGNITQSHYASTVIPLLNGIIERVTVSANQIEVHLILGSLIKQAVTTSHASPEACTNIDWSRLTHTLILPIQIKRSGLAVRLMVEPAEHRIKRIADPKLLKLLSKAHIWFDRLTQNNVLMQQIAEQEHVSRSYVSRVIRLAFLSPDIVKAIITGKAPEMLTADKLIRHIPLPIDWQAQHKLLGFD